MPTYGLVLDADRRIVAVNERVVRLFGLVDASSLLGKRPGQALGCVESERGSEGCGSGPACVLCGALDAIVSSLDSQGVSVREARLRTAGAADGGALDLEVQASHMHSSGEAFVVVSLRDVASEKRRTILERTFFHDVLNVVTGLQGVAELLAMESDDPARRKVYTDRLVVLAQQVGDEVLAQRQLLEAERGELRLSLRRSSARDTLEAVARLYRGHPVAAGKTLEIGSCPEREIETDPVLLRRALGNLVTNALEATDSGGRVLLWAEERPEGVGFLVHNARAMPADVQLQVFQRSFSTKAREGRGVGTHAAKLVCERYLGGSVSFVSEPRTGTVFRIALPDKPPLSM